MREELEQDARVALLQHYSSKSSNQVTNALTIALVFFAFVAAIDTLKSIMDKWFPLFSGLMVVLFLALAVHTANRVLYWGNLASYVLKSDFISPDALKLRYQESETHAFTQLYKRKKQDAVSLDDFRKKCEEDKKKRGEPLARDRDYTSASLNMES